MTTIIILYGVIFVLFILFILAIDRLRRQILDTYYCVYIEVYDLSQHIVNFKYYANLPICDNYYTLLDRSDKLQDYANKINNCICKNGYTSYLSTHINKFYNYCQKIAIKGIILDKDLKLAIAKDFMDFEDIYNSLNDADEKFSEYQASINKQIEYYQSFISNISVLNLLRYSSADMESRHKIIHKLVHYKL